MAKKLVPSLCPYCGVGCSYYFEVNEGRITGLEYTPEHPVTRGALCPKGNSVLEVIYHPDRLHYPLKKAKTGWQRVTWDKALSEVASKIETFRDSFGANSISFLASARCSNEENYVMQKLARLIGTNNIDHCARI